MKTLITIFIYCCALTYADFVPQNRPYDVEHYRISLELNPKQDPKDFKANTKISLKPKADLEKIVLDAEDLKIEKVVFKKKKLEFTQDEKNNTLEIKFNTLVKKDQKVDLFIFYAGKIREEHHGFFKVTDPDEPKRGPLFFTHFEALGARTFFPCNDEPYDKATTELIVKTPAENDVISNGKILRVNNFQRGVEPWYEVNWLMDKPHSTYLVALSIGKFKRISDRKRNHIFVGESKLKQADFAFEATKSSMKFFENYLDTPYPWAQYNSVGLPTYLWGGMENTGATFMNQERILLSDSNSFFDKKRIYGLVAHELAHQWFGDFVTMKWWDDIWLNEAFASFFSTEATKDYFKNNGVDIDFLLGTWEGYFKEEEGPRSHPIVDKGLTSPEDAFDATNYTKGENILRTLRIFVGESNFKKGLKEYLSTYKFSNANFSDFFAVMAKVSKVDLTSFQNTWLLQKGYPVVSYNTTWDSSNNKLRIDISQMSNHKDRSIFIFKLPLVFHRKTKPEYHKEFTYLFDKSKIQSQVELPAEPEWITLNPRGEVLVKIVPETQESLIAQAINDPEEITRAWASFELLSNLRNGTSLSQAAEMALASGLEKDASPYVKISVLESLQKMDSKWVPEILGKTIYKLSQENLDISKDPFGWGQYRSQLLGTLGKINIPEVLPYLNRRALDPLISIDDLSKVAFAIAKQGHENSGDILKKALEIQQKRGYRYQYAVQIAYGAYENAKAVSYIKDLTKSLGSDYFGRVGWYVKDNTTLKNSSEWSQFVKEFILKENKFGDSVKVRMLHSIEDVKNNSVKEMLQLLYKESSSQRIKDISKKILEKNFSENVS